MTDAEHKEFYAWYSDSLRLIPVEHQIRDLMLQAFEAGAASREGECTCPCINCSGHEA